jgi:hypothetical protein
MNYEVQFLRGILFLILVALAVLLITPDLTFWISQVLRAHSYAMRRFWRCQAEAFAEYVKVYRTSRQEGGM